MGYLCRCIRYRRPEFPISVINMAHWAILIFNIILLISLIFASESGSNEMQRYQGRRLGRYPHKRSVRSSRYFQPRIYSSGYPQTSGRGLAEMKMPKPKLKITPPPNTYNPYSLDLLSKLKDDLAIIGSAQVLPTSSRVTAQVSPMSTRITYMPRRTRRRRRKPIGRLVLDIYPSIYRYV